MKNIIKQLTELASTDRDTLKLLKHVAIKAQKYELSANLRDFELKNFPEAKKTDKEYKETEIFKTLLNIAELDVKMETSYVILECAKVFIEKGGESAIDDVARIKARAKEIFG